MTMLKDWASAKKVIETYALLETDKTNPITSALINNQNLNGLFHKVNEQVVMGAFHRECVLAYDLNTVLQKLFLAADFQCYCISQVGVYCAYDDVQRKYDLGRAEKDVWIQNAAAKQIGEGVWHKRFGTCKNYAPKISPLPFNVFKGEDQYIFVRDGAVIAVHISACVFNGTTLRTVRVYKVTQETETTSKVTMDFGGLFTDTVDQARIARGAASVRQQTFHECSPLDGPWSWSEYATNFLSTH